MTRTEIIKAHEARGLSPQEIIATTGISKSVVYRVLNSGRASVRNDDTGVFTCPLTWPADPGKYRAGVAP